MDISQAAITVFGGCHTNEALTEQMNSLGLVNTEMGSWIIEQRIKGSGAEPNTVAWGIWSDTQVGILLTASAEPSAQEMSQSSYDWNASDLPGRKTNWSHLTKDADKVNATIMKAAEDKDQGVDVC